MTILVKIDKFGKIFLPKKVRSKMKANQYEVVMAKGEVHLIPVLKPSELFGSLPDSNIKHLEEIHDEEHENIA